jgi:PEP-CTERM motif
MRTLQLLALVLLATAARADTLTFPYFYACDSGVVDCSAAFADSPHYYGDFGMNTVSPTGPFGPVGSGPSSMFLSNLNGIVIGINSDTGDASGNVIGQNGFVHWWPADNESAQFVDINNNNVAVGNLWANFADPGAGFIWQGGYDGAFIAERLPAGVVPGDCNQLVQPGCTGSNFNNVAINDSNQILVDVSFWTPDSPSVTEMRGVLSPFAVPEPSTLLLLATAVGVAWLVRRSLFRTA